MKTKRMSAFAETLVGGLLVLVVWVLMLITFGITL